MIWFILIPIIIFVSFIGMFVNMNGRHASKHEESEKVRRAFYKNGSYQVWQEIINKNTFHHIVDMDNGTFGDYIVIMESNGTMTEKTVFIPKGGNYKAIISWLKG